MACCFASKAEIPTPPLARSPSTQSKPPARASDRARPSKHPNLHLTPIVYRSSPTSRRKQTKKLKSSEETKRGVAGQRGSIHGIVSKSFDDVASSDLLKKQMPSATSGARRLLVAVDASTIAPDARRSSTLALAAALAAPGDEIHLLSVLPPRGGRSATAPLAPPLSSLLLPSPGLSTAAAAEAVVEARLRAGKEDRIAASAWLCSSRAALVGEFGVELERIALPLLHPSLPTAASSRASTAAAIVAYAHAKHADMVVLGARGMGALARALGGVVGLGSVSDAVVSGLHSGAVAVVRRGERPLLVSAASSAASSVPALVKIVVAVDGSPASGAALLFACRWASGGGALAGRATLLLVSAPQIPPFPAVFDDSPSSAVAASYGAERWEEEKVAAATSAKVAVEEAAATAVAHGVERSSIETAALDGSAKGGVVLPVVEALNEFAEAVGAHVVVAGSRGLGAWRAAALALVGLGSVSSGLLHSSKVPVVVVKSAQEEEVVCLDNDDKVRDS